MKPSTTWQLLVHPLIARYLNRKAAAGMYHLQERQPTMWQLYIVTERDVSDTRAKLTLLRFTVILPGFQYTGWER